MTRIVPIWLLAVAQLCAVQEGFAQIDRRAEAGAHFKAATQLFERGRLGEALEEYQKAYDTQAAFQTLYNLGQVHLAMGHWVEAFDAYERYLADGAAAVPAARRRAVEIEMRRLRERLADLSIHVQPDGAEVRVDGKIVGSELLTRPVRVVAGRHTVEAWLEGYRRAAKDIDLKGGEVATATLALDKLVVDTPPASIAAPTSPSSPEPAPTTAPQPAPASVEPSPPTPARTTPSPPPATALPPDRPGNGQMTAGWILAGVGLASAGVGTILLMSTLAKRDTATEDARRATNAGDTRAYEDARARHESAQSGIVPGGLVAGAGAAMTLTGLVLVLTAPPFGSTARVRWAPWFGASAVGADLAAAW